jgi:hypothetical protein
MIRFLIRAGPILFGSALFAGCVGEPVSPDATMVHPANPNAPASRYPVLDTGLLNLTNAAVTATGVGQPPEGPAHSHIHKQ